MEINYLDPFISVMGYLRSVSIRLLIYGVLPLVGWQYWLALA